MSFIDKDRLRIQFTEPWFFKDREDKMTLENDQIISVEIDRQMTIPQEQYYERLTE